MCHCRPAPVSPPAPWRSLFRRIENTAGRVLTRSLATVAGGRHGIDIGPRGIHRHIHVGKLSLHQLELADRLPELLALMEIGDDDIEASGHDPERSGRKHDPLIIEAGHKHLDALTHAAKHVFLRHLAIREDEFRRVRSAHAELVELLAGREAGKCLFHQESGDAARSGCRIGLGVDDQDICVRAVGDPHLAAVQDITVAALVCLEFHRNNIGAGAGLGHGKRPDMLARNQLRQISALLCRFAVAVDLIEQRFEWAP